ncbi:hypothetical protein [Pseudaestuariivita sp.]|uniref:hypothetical protein n=1 Tax=Pseudaestuariivita sp. TaxID=2211669 RepID=UPI004058E60D
MTDRTQPADAVETAEKVIEALSHLVTLCRTVRDGVALHGMGNDEVIAALTIGGGYAESVLDGPGEELVRMAGQIDHVSKELLQ